MKYCNEKIAECAEWVRQNGLMEHGGAALKDFCAAMGIDYQTYYRWLENAEFSESLTRAQKEYEGGLASRMVMTLAKAAEGYTAPPEVRVEKDGTGKVVKVIETTRPVAPNIRAAIFLLTNLDDKGWKSGERREAGGAGAEIRAECRTLIEERVTWFTGILKERGKDVDLLSPMIQVAAERYVRREMVSRITLSDGYQPVVVEYTREGGERRSVNPIEALSQKLSRDTEDALRAIGLTMDAKEGVAAYEDGTSDFLSKHNIDGQ